MLTKNICLLYNGYRVFPGRKERPGRDSDPSPPSSAIGHERVELDLYPPMGCMACTEPQCLYKGALYLFYHSAVVSCSEVVRVLTFFVTHFQNTALSDASILLTQKIWHNIIDDVELRGMSVVYSSIL